MALLEKKVVVITGGNSGIGFAIAQRFVAEGAYVFITGRRQEELDKAVRIIGRNVEAIQGDATISDDLVRLFEVVRQRKTRLDILVANSGLAEMSLLPDITEEHYDKVFALNARATLFTLKRALPLMNSGGSVVLVGSIAGSIGTPGYTTYGASKAVVRSFARTWANELAPSGIRVNVVSPGPIDTPMFDGASEEVRESLTKMIPLRRLGRPEEVAAAVLFLASDQSSFTTGSELCVDGGMAQV